jgi:hypothetical protein
MQGFGEIKPEPRKSPGSQEKGPRIIYKMLKNSCLWVAYFRSDSFSSETVSFLRPFFLRAASTFLPLAVAIRLRNPCLLVLFLRDG